MNSWGLDVLKVASLVIEDRGLTCVTYRIFQVFFSLVFNAISLSKLTYLGKRFDETLQDSHAHNDQLFDDPGGSLRARNSLS